MIIMRRNGQAIWRTLSLAGLIAAAVAAVSPAASAGECPPDKVVASGDGQKAGATAPKDVTDTVLAAVDLGKEINGMEGRKLRTRLLEIQPGGEVPWHSHADRPALIYVLEGTVEEYSSRCAVPIVHKAGDVSREENNEMHWWKNGGTTVVRLLSTDIFNEGGAKTASRKQ